MAVTFTLFGGVGVRIDGADVPIRGRRERAVLATLLAAGGRVVAADRLVEDVWEGAPPPTAAASLQVAVSRLRAAIEPDRGPREPSALLVTTAAGYGLHPDPAAVDAEVYAGLVDRALTALAAGDAAEAIALCDEAAGIRQGVPYAGAPESSLIRTERARLEELRLCAIEVRAEALLDRARHSLAAAELEPLLDEHPFRERLWQLAALAQYRSGRQADALATLRRARTWLADELGIDPSPELQELEGRILGQDPDLAAPTRPRDVAHDAPPERATGQRALVGRDTEFGWLRAMLHESAAGASRFAIVEGEPGIGKTRLLEELATAATGSGATAVWGRCADGQVAPAYWPWIEIVRGLLASGHGGDLPEDARAITDPAGLPPGGLTQDRRFRLFEAVVQSLETVAAAVPLVVVIEDLHWADAASAELLAHLALRLHDAPVLVVVSQRELELGRSDAVTEAVAALTRRAGTRRIALRGVPAAASGALVAAAVDRAVPAEVAAAIHRRGEGNPFCIGELSRLLAANGSLDDAGAVGIAEVPGGVRDVVRSRLAGLAPSTRAVLEVAAVIGREADLPILLAASGRSTDECLDALEDALVHRILVPVPEVPGRHRFAHALVAEAALAEVPSTRVARLHARVAEAVQQAGGSWETVAGHLWSAGPVVPPARTADALERAAELAVRRTAYENADGLLQRALGLRRAAALASGELAAEESELRTMLRFASLRRGLQGYGAAYAAIDAERAHELANRLGRTDLLMALLHLQWGALATACRVPEATRIAETIRDLGAASEDRLLRMLGHHSWGVQCWHLGRLQEGAAHMEHVDRFMRRIGADELERVETFDSGALFAAFALNVLDLAGWVDDADERYGDVVRRFPATYELVVVTNFVGFSALCAGDPERVTHWVRRFAPRADTDFGMFAATVAVFTGWAAALREQPESGLAVLEAGMSTFLLIGARTGLGTMLYGQIEAMLAAGRPPDEAAAVLARGAAEVEASGEPLTLPYLDLARAHVAFARRESSSEVAEHLRRAFEGAERSGNARLAPLVLETAERWGLEARSGDGEAGGRRWGNAPDSAAVPAS